MEVGDAGTPKGGKTADEAKDSGKLKDIQRMLEAAGHLDIAKQVAAKAEAAAPDSRGPTRKRFDQAAQFLSACRDKVEQASREVSKLEEQLEAVRQVASARAEEAKRAESLKDKIFKQLCPEEEGSDVKKEAAPPATAVAIDLEKALRGKSQAIVDKLAAEAEDSKPDLKTLIQSAMTAVLEAVRTPATETAEASREVATRSGAQTAELVKERSRSPHRRSVE